MVKISRWADEATKMMADAAGKMPGGMEAAMLLSNRAVAERVATAMLDAAKECLDALPETMQAVVIGPIALAIAQEALRVVEIGGAGNGQDDRAAAGGSGDGASVAPG